MSLWAASAKNIGPIVYKFAKTPYSGQNYKEVVLNNLKKPTPYWSKLILYSVYGSLLGAQSQHLNVRRKLPYYN